MFERLAAQEVPMQGMPATPVQQAVQEGGIISNFFDRLNLGWLFEKIGLSTIEGARILYFFLGAFAIGFLFKKYFKFLVGCSIVLALVFFVLHSNNIMQIDPNALRSFIGYDIARMDPNSMLNTTLDWIKTNLYVFIAGLIGFLVGYKIG
jgi:hypothetical protein